MELRVVLDTNVFLASEHSSKTTSPSRKIIQRWLTGQFVLLVTEDITSEYAEKLLSFGKSPSEVLHFLSKVLLLAEHISIGFFHLRHYPVDADDISFLLCACNGGATHLVSYDRHLLDLHIFYDDFIICVPLEFLKAMRSKSGG